MRSADIGAMIASAEQARDVLLTERARLLQICEALPHFSPERKAVEAFLSNPFLMHESTDGWREYPVVAPWRDAHQSLFRDADTPLPAIKTEATIVVLPSNGRE